METINSYKGNNNIQLGLIKDDGCLLDGMHKVEYYDSKYDVWCLYDSPHGNIINSECYYMKGDGRVIINHADVRRFVNGYATIRSYDDKDLEVVGKRGLRRLRIYDSEGNVMGHTFWAGAKLISSPKDKGIVATYQCWCFPTDYERQINRYNPKCMEYFMYIYENGKCDVLGGKEVEFNEHINEFI